MIYFQGTMTGRIKLIIGAAVFVMAMAYSVSWAGSAEAAKRVYKYVDEKGTVHVTDSYGNIPEKYRKSVREKEVDTRTYGYTPSVDAAVEAEKFSTDAWFDYVNMPFNQRWFLLARAGFIDIAPILKVMAPWIGLALFILVASYFIIFKVFEAPLKKGVVLMLVFIGITGAIFIKYVRVVENHSEMLVRKVKANREMDAERQKRLVGVLESVKQ